MSDITYWLVAHSIAGCSVYYRLTAQGEPEATPNSKLAMRWHTQEGAIQFAARLGWPWKAVAVKFLGNEMVA